MSRQWPRAWRLSSFFAVVTMRLASSWTHWRRSRKVKRLRRAKARAELLNRLFQEQLDLQRRLEDQLYPKLATMGVHPHLLANRMQGPVPAPEPLPEVPRVQGPMPDLLLTDRTRTELPLPEPTEELPPMPPAEQQLTALLTGPGPQPS